tara:strand:+ start:1776 stop:2111 length:336 start_codon:yes stop_codon:yes gene_type:complete
MSNTYNKDEKRNEWKEREVGALWVQKSAKGQKYMTGHVSISPNTENTKVVIFENSGKKDENGKVKNEKAPDFRVYLSETTQSSKTSETTEKASSQKEATESVPQTEEEVLF